MNSTTEKTSPAPASTPPHATDSVLILIDHHRFQFANLRNMDPTLVLNNTIGLAKGPRPSACRPSHDVVEDRGGRLPQALQDVFPDQKPIDRTSSTLGRLARVGDR